MKYQCEICGLMFTDAHECFLHERNHENDVIWRQVHLRRENGKWEFSYTERRKGQLNGNIMSPTKVVCDDCINERPTWWVAAECTSEAQNDARRRLKAAALAWYAKRIKGLEELETDK